MIRKIRLLKLLIILVILVLLALRHKSIEQNNETNEIFINEFLKNLTEIYQKLASNNGINLKQDKIILSEKNIFSLIYDNDGFLVDVNLQLTNRSIYLFGIYFENFLKFNQQVKSNFVNYCKYNLAQNKYYNLTILTALYLKCDNFWLQVSIFYNRGNFVWIPNDNFPTEYKKIFNDKPRAINRFDLVSTNLFQSINKLPANKDKFIYDYKNSQFLECGFITAWENSIKYGIKNRQIKHKNEEILRSMKNVKKIFESFYKDYWLVDGTLLGWYRDCGIIPHTTDVDFGMFISDFNKDIKNKFKGDPITPLILQLGLLNDSFELRVGTEKLHLDIFYYYEYNNSHYYSGYHSKRLKYRTIISKFKEICSADLLNEKFLVPCNAVEYIHEEFGREDWKIPRKKFKSWLNVIPWGKWSEEEYSSAIKFYDSKGNFLKNFTINFINQLLENKITQVFD